MSQPNPPSYTYGTPAPGGSMTGGIAMPQGTFVAKAKEILFKNFEVVLVVVVLGSLLFISSVVVHKYAFLLFYFIPVLMAGYYLGARYSVAIALLTAGFVVYVALVDPFGQRTTGEDSFSFWNLMIWASFLTLTGAIVGQLQEKNNLQMKKLRDAYMGIIQILTKYLESADAYTKNHSERVAEISTALARRLGLSADLVHNVRSAALLHDIGKIEVIDLINKEGALSDEEKTEVDRHTELGAEIILTTGTVLNDVIPLVLAHHRRYDDGGDSIPIGARIIAVADTYDAVRTDRPYRAGRLHWQAVEILQDGAGSQWDPRIVEALSESEGDMGGIYKDAQ